MMVCRQREVPVDCAVRGRAGVPLRCVAACALGKRGSAIGSPDKHGAASNSVRMSWIGKEGRARLLVDAQMLQISGSQETVD